jgi:exodeoxyribonuclease VII small subunit
MSKKKMTFEESMNRLEQIVRSMERGDVALEESLKLFQEGTELVRSCNRLLDEAKAPLRGTLMELVEDRLEHLCSEEHDHSHGHCRCHDMEALFVKVNHLLKQLNSEAFDPSPEEVDKIQSEIEKYADRLEELLD